MDDQYVLVSRDDDDEIEERYLIVSNGIGE